VKLKESLYAIATPPAATITDFHAQYLRCHAYAEQLIHSMLLSQQLKEVRKPAEVVTCPRSHSKMGQLLSDLVLYLNLCVPATCLPSLDFINTEK
jgi:hypothetical protein